MLRGRDGRALRHLRFFYFAVNTLLRNKAVRGKSYFVKKTYGDQAPPWDVPNPWNFLAILLPNQVSGDNC